jgi:hypothetical protein
MGGGQVQKALVRKIREQDALLVQWEAQKHHPIPDPICEPNAQVQAQHAVSLHHKLSEAEGRLAASDRSAVDAAQTHQIAVVELKQQQMLRETEFARHKAQMFKWINDQQQSWLAQVATSDLYS